MEELWNGIHQSSLQDFLSRGSIKDKDQNEKQVDDADDKNEMFKKEFLNSLNTPGFISSLNSPFEALATVAVSSSATSLLNSTCFSVKNKRMSEDQNIVDGEIGVDQRHKRMMKNRESAARSRARRQAYTSQLEREHAELKEENAKLRKQQQMVITYLN
uniref:BZIP domain-containing protein n=1 Tax=Chenopodium quinoa TaxID=63459 RepID=A0A803LIX0_CHEQI